MKVIKNILILFLAVLFISCERLNSYVSLNGESDLGSTESDVPKESIKIVSSGGNITKNIFMLLFLVIIIYLFYKKIKPMSNSKKLGYSYLFSIIIFGFLYAFFTPEMIKGWKEYNNILYPDFIKLLFISFYYSVVTITTLGFGDISPNNILSMTLTVSESILGIVIIGAFLNAIAVRISEDKDEEIRARKMKKICGILEPLLKTHIKTLNDMKSSSSIKGKDIPIFSNEFIEEIVLLCGNAEFQQVIPKMSVAKYFASQFETTQKELKDFIVKFITLIDDDFLFLLNDFSESNAFGEINYFERKHQNKKWNDIEMTKSMNIPDLEKQKMIDVTLSKENQPIPLFMEWIRTGIDSKMPLEACNFYNHIKNLEKIVLEVEKVLEKKIEFDYGKCINNNYSIILTDANPGVYLNYTEKLLY